VVEAAKSVLAESEEVWGTTDALVDANLLAALRAAVAADTQENAIRTAHQIDVGEYVSASALDVPALLEEVRRFKRAFYQELRDNMRDAATPLFAELEKRKEVP
jgi:HPt (histidine-containing phosphotransfer) domain-containing protein